MPVRRSRRRSPCAGTSGSFPNRPSTERREVRALNVVHVQAARHATYHVAAIVLDIRTVTHMERYLKVGDIPPLGIGPYVDNERGPRPRRRRVSGLEPRRRAVPVLEVE